jgi:hypothetical protein
MRKELTSLVLVFLIILTAVSLFSFHAQDPALGHDVFAVPDTIHNQFGLLGAHVAGFFIFLFGVGAFWVRRLPLFFSHMPILPDVSSFSCFFPSSALFLPPAFPW